MDYVPTIIQRLQGAVTAVQSTVTHPFNISLARIDPPFNESKAIINEYFSLSPDKGAAFKKSFSYDQVDGLVDGLVQQAQNSCKVAVGQLPIWLWVGALLAVILLWSLFANDESGRRRLEEEGLLVGLWDDAGPTAPGDIMQAPSARNPSSSPRARSPSNGRSPHRTPRAKPERGNTPPPTKGKGKKVVSPAASLGPQSTPVSTRTRRGLLKSSGQEPGASQKRDTDINLDPDSGRGTKETELIPQRESPVHSLRSASWEQNTARDVGDDDPEDNDQEDGEDMEPPLSPIQRVMSPVAAAARFVVRSISERKKDPWYRGFVRVPKKEDGCGQMHTCGPDELDCLCGYDKDEQLRDIEDLRDLWQQRRFNRIQKRKDMAKKRLQESAAQN